ncbi:extracellular solute-binding protein [Gordonia humi]
MKMNLSKRLSLAAVALATTVGLAACGSDEPAGELATGGWDEVVAAAKNEGTVTIYSSQGATQVDDLAAGFQDKYGVKVEVVRDIDANLLPKIDAELRTGKPAADVLVQSTESAVKKYSEDGVLAEPVAPSLKDIDVMRDDNYFDVDATVITFAWNTDQFHGKLNNYQDLLNKDLKGKIGVPEPTVAAFVDFYLYLEDLYGDDFSAKLAAQDPKIYPGALPAAQALSSGEIAAAAYVEPQADEKKAGAPVDWGFEKEQWSAMFYGSMLKGSAHPNAAQLLTDYMMSAEGQQRIARKAASARPDIPGTVATLDTVHRMDTTKITPEVIADYQAKWNKLFR